MPGPAMFTSLDPYFGDTGEPQSLHKYAYVHGDPVNAWDPTGMTGFFSLSIAQVGYLVLAGATFGAIFQAALNYAQNRPILQWNVLWGALIGGVLAPFMLIPELAFLASLIGLRIGAPLVAEVWTNPESSSTQKGVALLAVIAPFVGARVAAARFRSQGWQLGAGRRPPARLNPDTTTMRSILEPAGAYGDEIYVHMTPARQSAFDAGLRSQTYFAKTTDIGRLTVTQYRQDYLAGIGAGARPDANLAVIVKGANKFVIGPKHPNNRTPYNEYYLDVQSEAHMFIQHDIGY